MSQPLYFGKIDFDQYGIKISFEESGIDEIARVAMESEGGGARGLVGVVERTLRDYKYELPGTALARGGGVLVVDRELVRRPAEGLAKILAKL